MKKKLFKLLVVFSTFIPVGSFCQRVTPYIGSRLFWDINSQVVVFHGGNYGRLIELKDGRLLSIAESQGGISVTFSNNKGLTWTSPNVIISNTEKIFFAAPDVVQLSDGTIIVGYNPRPSSPYSSDRLFGIRVMRSTDNGKTWNGPFFVYDAKYTFNNGCWEPSFLELPSGELQCYFANENDYILNDDQNISMCRSFDKGLTWSSPVIVSYRSGARDGMPVPLLLKDKSEIVVIIEDNGWADWSNFVATTVRNALQDNWSKGYVNATSPNRNILFKTVPPNDIVSAAPYICQLPWGETIASYQSNENRNSADLQYLDMYVVVGDERAKNFKAKSAPFSLTTDKHSIWNSVSVIDTGIVVAMGSVGVANGINDIVMIKGYPIRLVKADYGSITVDGMKTGDEKWTTNNASQLCFGSITKNKATVDFLYDDKYLYFTSKVIDRNIINTTDNNDGVRLMVDALDVSTSKPQTGMYNFFFDTNGKVKFQRGDSGQWITDSNTTGIKYSVSLSPLYNNYFIEAAIPWSVLGQAIVPNDKRMSLAVEVVNKEPNSVSIEGISDVDKDASWTWLEFRLNSHTSYNNVEIYEDNNLLKTFVKDRILNVTGSSPIEELSLFSLNGKLLLKKIKPLTDIKIQLPLNETEVILKCSFLNRKILTQKIICK